MRLAAARESVLVYVHGFANDSAMSVLRRKDDPKVDPPIGALTMSRARELVLPKGPCPCCAPPFPVVAELGPLQDHPLVAMRGIHFPPDSPGLPRCPNVVVLFVVADRPGGNAADTMGESRGYGGEKKNGNEDDRHQGPVND